MIVGRRELPHQAPMAEFGSVGAVAQDIQLAVAPVLLLTGIGSILAVLTARLGRVIDRARHVEAHFDEYHGSDHDIAEAELRVLDGRMRVVQWAVGLCTLAATLICAVIAIIFVGDMVTVRLDTAIAALFITAMVAVIAGLLLFLREIQVAMKSVRVRPALLKKSAHRWG